MRVPPRKETSLQTRVSPFPVISSQEDCQHGERGEYAFENREPDVGEVRAVGCRAVDVDSEGDACCGPDDQRGGYELKDHVPCSLRVEWEVSDMVWFGVEEWSESSVSDRP